MTYELMLLLKPLTNEDVKEKVFSKIEKMITDLKGSITIKDSVGKRLLAYEIDGFKEGYYLVCELKLENAQDSKVIEKNLSLTNEVLRFSNISTANL